MSIGQRSKKQLGSNKSALGIYLFHRVKRKILHEYENFGFEKKEVALKIIFLAIQELKNIPKRVKTI